MKRFNGKTFLYRAFLRVGASLVALAAASVAAAGIADRVIRTEAAGVEVLIYPMGVKDVVTVVGSLPAGTVYATREGGNPTVPSLVGMMLDQGTEKQDKYAVARQLESVGAGLSFSVGMQTVSISGRSLRKDADTLIRLLAEQLRHPAFSAEEFGRIRKQLESQLRSQLEDTGSRARIAFLQSVFPEGHPNRPASIEDWLAAVDRATLDELKAFHRKYYGPAHLRLVFAGDVDPEAIRASVASAFEGWSGGVEVARTAKRAAVKVPREQTIRLADKASFSVLLGQSTGLRFQDPDRLALAVGTAILGSGFSGRLMGTVRDKEGLTYGISAGLSDDTFVDGNWAISATFAPDLLEKGIASTRRELQTWWQKGVTERELEARKTSLIGGFQVGLATTYGMASAILQSLERGVGIEWLDRYPQAVNALTVEQVNAAIRKYLDPKKMILIKAG